MTCGEKIAAERKKRNMTQDDLAEVLGVTRQAVSRWESNAAYPETEKLVRLAELFDLDLNYLLKDGAEPKPESCGGFAPERFHYQYTSKAHIGKLPLVCVNIGFGFYKARGVIAVGNAAAGVVSIGLCSAGVFSAGLLSFGLLALGCIAAGGVALAAVALGMLAVGAVACGLVSFGALSVGAFSAGALSVGGYFAMGDVAWAKIALGMTSAHGQFAFASGVQGAFSYDKAEVAAALSQTVPPVFGWLKDIVVSLL